MVNIEFPGVSYPGQHRVEEIVKEVQRQAKAAMDFIIDAKCMKLVLDDTSGIALTFTTPTGMNHTFPLSRRAYLQLAQWVGLPTNSALYKRLRWGTTEPGRKRCNEVFWPTWINLINDHFEHIKTHKLIRTMECQGQRYIRAFLSDRYMIIPNDQLLYAVADKLMAQKVEIWNAKLSEDSFYLYAVAPGVGAQIRTDRPWEGYRFIGEKDDVVNAALMIKNSETGQGGCEVCPAILHGISNSYLVRQSALSIRHLGARHKMDELLSLETLKKRNAIVYDEIRDYCTAVFNADKFQQFVAKLQDATQDEVEPTAAVDALQSVFDISEDRQRDVMKWLIKTGDRSRYGLANAVASIASHDTAIDPDEAANLQNISSELIEKYTAIRLAKVATDREKNKAFKQVEARRAAVESELVAAGGAS